MHQIVTPPGLAISWAPVELTDVPELSRLFNEIAEFEDTPERMSPETMEHLFDSAFRPFDERTIVGRAESGEVVAYGTLYHRPSDAEEQRAYFSAHLSPAWRDRGLEDALVDWGLVAGGHELERAAGSEKYLCSWLYKKKEGAAARLERLGFEAGRHWWEMERMLDEEIDDSAVEGFAVFPWVDEHSKPVRLVLNEAFVDHWGFTPMSEEYWLQQSIESPSFRQDLSCVAVGDGELVGYSYAIVLEEDWEAAGRSEGWIGGLGVLSDWRKKGIATALLIWSMQAMKAAGLEAAMIGVDSSSPSGAQHLYHDLGFRTKTTGTTWQRRYT
jgi:ribosomal protein S18 acetylase RimI-like enzyme